MSTDSWSVIKGHINVGRASRATDYRGRQCHLEYLEDRRLLAAEVLYRVNAGGPSLAGGWSMDTSGSPSPYSNVSASQSTSTTVGNSINLSHPSVPAGTPAALFQTERWDQTSGSEMQWDFPVTPGTYEVRLYFAETYAKAQKVGGRTFDVFIEGQQVLDDYDVYAEVGGYTGVVKTFTVAADSILDVDFLRNVQNPSVKGIEIIKR